MCRRGCNSDGMTSEHLSNATRVLAGVQTATQSWVAQKKTHCFHFIKNTFLHQPHWDWKCYT